MRRILLPVVALLALALSGPATAAEVLAQDDQGRTIRFDVRAEGVDVEWYAALLRAAPHGDEITTVRIDIVPPSELRATCGGAAAGCYRRNVIVVPAEQSEENAHTLIHEYGHHLDRSTPVAGVAEPNGTPHWWRVRGMAQLLRLGSVATTYRLGWDRSIGEIFAEDYAQLVRPDGFYAIRWLRAPDEVVLAALRADFGLGPPPAVTPAPALKPVSIARRGVVAPKRRAAIPFGLLGPGRRVQATATLSGAAEKKRVRATLQIRCDGTVVATKRIGRGKTKLTLDRRNLGPADCTATLTSSSATRRAYTLTVRLSVGAGT